VLLEVWHTTERSSGNGDTKAVVHGKGGGETEGSELCSYEGACNGPLANCQDFTCLRLSTVTETF
jgi:hypothetical protein